MKALLIDSYGEKVVSEVDIKSWRDIAPLLDCRVFTTVRISETDYVYVDDEGLYSGVAQKFGAFKVQGYPDPLMGRGLVLGSRPDGESADAAITVEEMQKLITPLMVL